MSFWRFLKYNNAVPIVISLVLLSFGTTLAASPEIRSEVGNSIVQKESAVISIDNTYIAGKDLTAYTPRVEIIGVTVDAEHYYVAYRLSTIDLKDAVWQDVLKEELLTVAKDALEGMGLGIYATRELKQRVDKERELLVEVQAIERKVVTQRTVSTTYSGLIGTFIDDTTEVVPPYVPPIENVQEQGASIDSVAGGTVQTTPASGGAGAPQLQILGNNPARLSLGEVYNDLGVLVTDDSGADLGYKTFLDGREVRQIQIPSTVHATYIVRYEATDAAGNVGVATRTVIMGNGTPAEQPEDTQTTATSTVVE